MIECYARNERLGLLIPYDRFGMDHEYEPDYVVRISDNRFLIIEVKGWHREDVKDKHEAARCWADAVYLWGKTGKWLFHVNKDSQSLRNELDCITG